MKKILIYILLLILPSFASAQYFPFNNQFIFNKADLFPAYSGFNENTEVFLSYQHKFVGFPGAPKIADFFLGGNITDNMGYSINFKNLSSGNFNQTFLSASYAYFIQLSDNTFINVSLSPTLINRHFNIASVQSFPNRLDPVLASSNLAGYSFDIGLSLAFYSNGFNFAISAPQTLGLKQKLSNSTLTNDRLFCSELSYRFKSGQTWFEPFIFAIADQKLKFDFSVGSSLSYNKILYSALAFNYDGQLSLSLGGIMAHNLFISYTYSFGLYGLDAITQPSHTISVAFVLQRGLNTREPSIFPTKSLQTTIIDLQNEIDDLNSQLKKERNIRHSDVKNLQNQIDSLNIKLKNINTQHPNSQQTTQQNNNNNIAPNSNPTIPSPNNASKANSINWKQKFIAKDIQFGLNSSVLLSSSYSELDKYAELLKKDPNLKIRIIVHTDNLGSPEFKLQLSQSRAKAIANYLISKGVSPNQIFYEGRGGSQPIASNLTLEGRRKNNRVVIMFNKKVIK